MAIGCTSDACQHTTEGRTTSFFISFDTICEAFAGVGDGVVLHIRIFSPARALRLSMDKTVMVAVPGTWLSQMRLQRAGEQGTECRSFLPSFAESAMVFVTKALSYIVCYELHMYVCVRMRPMQFSTDSHQGRAVLRLLPPLTLNPCSQNRISHLVIHLFLDTKFAGVVHTAKTTAPSVVC